MPTYIDHFSWRIYVLIVKKISQKHLQLSRIVLNENFKRIKGQAL